MTSMFNKPWARRAFTALLALAAAGAAQAHPGHAGDGFAAGLAHPFLGLDHLLAMVAVGAWSCLALPAGKRLAGPLVFMALLAVGALLGPQAHIGTAGIEIGVALSVVLFGVLLLVGRKLNATAGLAIVGASALVHGLAHGNDLLNGQPAALAMIAGMLLGSALLHGAGYVAGARMQSAPRWVHQLAAAGLGASGLVMLAARL